jgi:hypothetical protein
MMEEGRQTVIVVIEVLLIASSSHRATRKPRDLRKLLSYAFVFVKIQTCLVGNSPVIPKY